MRNVVLILVALTVGLGSIAFTKVSQTTYFTQSLTTVSTWSVTWAEGTATMGLVCGNTPWNMTVITAVCENEPIPEFPFAPIIAFAVLVASALLLRRRHR